MIIFLCLLAVVFAVLWWQDRGRQANRDSRAARRRASMSSLYTAHWWSRRRITQANANDKGEAKPATAVPNGGNRAVLGPVSERNRQTTRILIRLGVVAAVAIAFYNSKENRPSIYTNSTTAQEMGPNTDGELLYKSDKGM